jgi:SAM-dependent methyltransferase
MTKQDKKDPRLYPKWTHARYVGLIKLREAIEYVIEKYLSNARNATLIDLGCGSMPYKPLFSHAIMNYVGADISLESADVLLDANTGRVEAGDSSFDYILSTQVLEHVNSPVDYLKEAHRLCKPDGTLILSTHGFWLYHPNPTDFWRWTNAGLKKILEDNGWTVQETVGILGFAAASLCLFQDAMTTKLPKRLRKPFWIFMQRVIGFFDSYYSTESRQENAALYLIVAKKK